MHLTFSLAVVTTAVLAFVTFSIRRDKREKSVKEVIGRYAYPLVVFDGMVLLGAPSQVVAFFTGH